MRGFGVSPFTRLAFASQLFTFLVNAASPVCYDGSGNQNTSMVPCDASVSPSGCCPFQYACLSNGLCQSPFGGQTAYSNFGCTDPNGDTGTCKVFSECALQGSVGIITCNDNSYVCYNNGDCAETGLIFQLPVGTIVTTIPPRSVYLTQTISTGSILTTTSQSASTTYTAMSTSTMSTSIVSTSVTSSTLSSPSSSGVAIGVGVGVAVGVGFIVAAVLGFWCWRRREKRKFGLASQDEIPQQSHFSDSKSPPIYGSQQYAAVPHIMPTEMDSTVMPSELASTRI